MEELEFSAGDSNEGLDLSFRKMPKPPDKKKFEAEQEELMGQIQKKEKELRTLVASKGDSSTTNSQETLRALRKQKNDIVNDKAVIETKLREINKEISNKNGELTKIQCNLQGYRNEVKLDEAIRKLEHQLKTTNFKVREERQIVTQIDNLKRSRKCLISFNQEKRKLDGMRDEQRRMREQRDKHYKTVTGLKCQEDEIRQKVQIDKAKTETLRKDISDLYDQKRAMIQKFKVQEKEYNDQLANYRRKRNEDFKRKKAEERHERELAYQKDWAEYEASRQPYEDEMTLCTTLISYLQPFMPTDVRENLSPASSTSGESVDCLAQSFEKEGLVLLKKKEEDLFSGLTKAKTNKRGKKEKKKTLHKPILHVPQTLAQFASLEIKAPSSSQEVSEAIQQIESKKKYYKSLASTRQLPRPCVIADDGEPGYHGYSSPPSVAESAFTESFPSTPEVCTDNSPPRFPTGPQEAEQELVIPDHQPRRLSYDSGACELEGVTEDLENPIDPFRRSIYSDVASESSTDLGDESAGSSTSSGGTVVENSNLTPDLFTENVVVLNKSGENAKLIGNFPVSHSVVNYSETDMVENYKIDTPGENSKLASGIKKVAENSELVENYNINTPAENSELASEIKTVAESSELNTEIVNSTERDSDIQICENTMYNTKSGTSSGNSLFGDDNLNICASLSGKTGEVEYEVIEQLSQSVQQAAIEEEITAACEEVLRNNFTKINSVDVPSATTCDNNSQETVTTEKQTESEEFYISSMCDDSNGSK